MKTLLTVLCILIMATAAWGAKPPGVMNGSTERVGCTFEYINWAWDFSQGDHGFTTGTCDAEGLPTWEWGTETVVFGSMDVWGTTLNGAYQSETGEALISPSWVVDDTNYLVQLVHWYNIENSYDGGNLMVNGVVVPPSDGYPDDELSDSTNYYAWCVDTQPGFTGEGPTELFASCFDLTDFIGEEVQLQFQFGSDSSVTYPGWYLAVVIVGTDLVATDAQTWTQLKATYR